MSRMTNNMGISLPVAVWLATEEYDFKPGERRAISATSLLKPVRQTTLKYRLTEDTAEIPDISDFIASRLGHAIHDSVEKAWKNAALPRTLEMLGIAGKIAANVEVNPENPDPKKIQVWLEQRREREFMGYSISGKFDMVLNGELQDFKSTSVYTFIKGGKDRDYQLQGSLYRWLNPDLITSDYINIQFFFTDFQKSMAKTQANYPKSRIQEHRVPLLSIQETEAWLRKKILALEAAADLPEEELPRCTDEELWRSEPVFKYFADANKTDGRSTKNCESMSEALAYQASKGGKGIVIEVPGKVKACSYCAGFPICSQKDEYDLE